MSRKFYAVNRETGVDTIMQERYKKGRVNMYDKEFLQCIHERLRVVHGENRNVDYMCKLRSIIEAYDPKTLTPNTAK